MKNREQGKRELASNAKLRLFFALWPNAAVRDALHKLAGERQVECGGRITPAESLHLTLLFLGDVPAASLPVLREVAEGLSADPFDFVLRRFGVWRHSGIGYAAPLDVPGEMQYLAEQLRVRIATAGMAFDRRRFVPHVTLLRKAERLPARQLKLTLSWPVQDFRLVSSVLDGRGASYQTLGSWRLVGPG